ncbi:MAG: serine/threonine-protein kinase [Myxococcota bacterium]
MDVPDDTPARAKGSDSIGDGPTERAEPPRSPSQQKLHDGVKGALFDGAPLPPAEYEPGAMLGGRYRILALLGRGGMGVVYRADDLVLGEQVALKFLPDELARRPEYLERLAQEVRTARRVSHKNLCRVHDIAETDGRRFLSMEYVDGEDLSSLLRRIGRLDHDKGVELAHQLCAGLAALHEQGVLHRDLKPSNVMIDGEGRLKIADFGLAALAGELGEHEIRDGTPAYQAPEQARGEAVTERSDLFALGLILREMFVGSEASGTGSTTGTPRSRVSPEVAELIDSCLEADPLRRPASVRAAALGLPGGDPVERALAQGRLLSAEAVANAPTAGVLKPAIAWAVVAVIALLIMGASALQVRMSPLRLTETLDPAVLEHRADELLAEFAPGRDAQRAVFYAWNQNAKARLTAPDTPSDDPFAQPFRVIVRTSDRPFPVRGRAMTRRDPHERAPGMASATVNGRGKLRRLLINPARDDEPAASPPPADWAALLDAAGLADVAMRRSDPTRMPPVHVDEHASWTTDDGVRIHAGWRGGAPVWLEVTPPRLDPPATWKLENGPVVMFLVAIALLLAIGFPLIMVRSLREGASDFVGARRLGYAFIAVLLLGHLSGESEGGFSFRDTTVFSAVGIATLAALAYGAIEPYARRTMPRALVSWNRVLRGRFGDPMVGRDVLYGLAVGFAAVIAAAVGVMLDHGTLAPAAVTVGGGFRALGPVFGSLLFGPAMALVLLAALLTINTVIKRRQLAIAIVVVAIGLGWNGPDFGRFVGIILAAGLLGVILRFGVLTGVTAAAVGFAGLQLPLALSSRVGSGTALAVWPFVFIALAIACAHTSSRGTTAR